MRVILAILFLSFASHAKAEDQLWIIIWGQHSSENHAKIGVGIANHLDKSNFKSKNECEQYLISHFLLEHDQYQWVAETLPPDNRLRVRIKDFQNLYPGTVYGCDQAK